MNNSNSFNEKRVLEKLKHYLPSQAPLKDFVHHNTLHAFQSEKFDDGIRIASKVFGYKTTLSVAEYRALYHDGRIKEEVLKYRIEQKKGKAEVKEWLFKMVEKTYDYHLSSRVGALHAQWRKVYKIDLDTIVQTNLFRILNSYLDQGIAMWPFPMVEDGFLASIRALEEQSFVSLFKTRKGKELLFDANITLTQLLEIVVGDPACFEQYLFDQQFAHKGWSGMVAVIENQPHTLLDQKKITLEDFIKLELILEIDNLTHQLGRWVPLCQKADSAVKKDLFGEVPVTEQDEVLMLWQEAYEWSYYDEVLAGLQLSPQHEIEQENREEPPTPSFQAFFCIDDRECSIRRWIEHFAPHGITYGTPGHFGIDTYYQPEFGKFYTKVCPGPVQPKHLIKELGTHKKRQSDVHFAKHTHHLLGGWIITQTLGFWSAIKLFLNIFKPSLSPASSFSFRHMDENSDLTVMHSHVHGHVDGLQVGYTLPEMADRVEGVLKSTGLASDFAPLIYIVGHGASSANNTHYAGYDCGACSGRPGSVNARAFCIMANNTHVRELLSLRGIEIPETTQFLAGLHDTTRDEIKFYDEELLSQMNRLQHTENVPLFDRALQMNAKERSRRFVSINTKRKPAKIHEKVKQRSVSLFEPRPELNHATNALCIVGRRELNNHLFLDRRSFLNSYDYRIDPEGTFLLNILNAAAPVCGGINLEYYFSRVDNQKLGAGSKLPHNVMGLFGVANGFEGDLRTGLPYQMVEVHDPVRLMLIVEHYPKVVLEVIRTNPATYEWIKNEWVKFTVIHPETRDLFVFEFEELLPYRPLHQHVPEAKGLEHLIELTEENFPVFELEKRKGKMSDLPQKEQAVLNVLNGSAFVS